MINCCSSNTMGHISRCGICVNVVCRTEFFDTFALRRAYREATTYICSNGIIKYSEEARLALPQLFRSPSVAATSLLRSDVVIIEVLTVWKSEGKKTLSHPYYHIDSSVRMLKHETPACILWMPCWLLRKKMESRYSRGAHWIYSALFIFLTGNCT